MNLFSKVPNLSPYTSISFEPETPIKLIDSIPSIPSVMPVSNFFHSSGEFQHNEPHSGQAFMKTRKSHSTGKSIKPNSLLALLDENPDKRHIFKRTISNPIILENPDEEKFSIPKIPDSVAITISRPKHSLGTIAIIPKRKDQIFPKKIVSLIPIHPYQDEPEKGLTSMRSVRNMKNLDEATLSAKPTETFIDLQRIETTPNISKQNERNCLPDKILESSSQLSPIFKSEMREKMKTMEKIMILDRSRNEETSHTKKPSLFSQRSKIVPIRPSAEISEFEKEEVHKEPPSIKEIKGNDDLQKNEQPQKKEFIPFSNPITQNIDSKIKKEAFPNKNPQNPSNSAKNDMKSSNFSCSSPSESNQTAKKEVHSAKEDLPSHLVIEKVVKMGSSSFRINKTIESLHYPKQSKPKLELQTQPQALFSFFPRSSLEALVRNARGATRTELKLCRFCLYPELKDNNLLIPCGCEGNGRYVHEDCLKTWIIMKKQIVKPKCEVCQVQYNMTYEIERKFNWYFGRPDLIVNIVVFILLLVLMGAITSILVVMTVGWSRDLHLGESSEIGLITISIIAMVVNFYVILKVRKPLLYKWKVQHWKILNRSLCQPSTFKKEMKEVSKGETHRQQYEKKNIWEKIYNFIRLFSKKCNPNYSTSSFFKYEIVKTSLPKYKSYNVPEKLLNAGGKNKQQVKTTECFKNKFRKTLIDVNYKKLKVDLNGFLAEIPDDLIDSQNNKKVLHLLMEVDRDAFESIKNLSF